MNPVRVGLIASLCLGLSGCWEPKPATWSNATGIEQFERLWWQAVKDKKWPEVERRLAATYAAQSSGATYDRQQALDRLRQLEITEFSLGDADVRPDGNAAVITYTMNLRGSFAGQPMELRQARMMTVWQQQKSGWVAIAHADSLQ